MSVQVIISLKNRVSVSARGGVSEKSLDAALKLFLSYSTVFRFSFKEGMKRKITIWHTEAKEFLQSFGLPVRTVNAITKRVLDDKHDEELETMLDDFFKILGKKMPEIKKDRSIANSDISMLNDIRVMYLRDSESAEKRIARNVSHLRDTDLNYMFVTEEDYNNLTEVSEELKALVKKYTNKGYPFEYELPSEVLKVWAEYAREKGKKKPDHEKYFNALKALRNNYKSWLKNTIRSSGKTKMSSHELVREAKNMGVVHFIPKGFVGKIDDLGNYYTTDGKRLQSNLSGEVEMNQQYDPEKDETFVLWMKSPAMQDRITISTLERAKASKVKKFKRVATLTDAKMKALSKKWLTDMQKLANPNIQERSKKKAMIATVIEFIYHTGARVGSPTQKTNNVRTFGTTTLEVRHLIKNTATKLVFKYLPGKSSGAKNKEHMESSMQIHNIVNEDNRQKLLIKIIRSLVEGKNKTDKIFTVNGSILTQREVNSYLRSLGYQGSIKDLRTMKGTYLMRQLLNNSHFKENVGYKDTEVNKWIIEQAKIVGEKLGHTTGGKVTGSTAIQNYINPSVIADFLDKHKIRPNATLEKVIKTIQV